MSVEANARVTVLNQSHICCVLFQHRLFFVMHKGNGLSVYLAPFTLSCCTCITFADKLFRGVESHEKSRRAGMNEGHRGRKTVRQRNDRGTFHRERHEKLLSTLTGGVAFRMTQPALQSHPFQDSLLNFY